MTRSALPKLGTYAALTALFLVAAVAFGRSELVSLAAPFAVFLGIGLARLPAHAVTVESAIGAGRAVEGGDLELKVGLRAGSRIDRLELVPVLPPGLELRGARPPAVNLAAGQERVVPMMLDCRRFGGYRLGSVVIRAFDRFGLVADEGRTEAELRLAVYPEAEHLQRLVQPLRTQPYAGNQVARTKGDGIEFADIRPFTSGDRVRSINWRASARTQELHVNEHRPERNADVVIFLDSFAEARREDGSTLDRAIRAAAALAGHYLDRRDRVGLVGFGGMVRWLTPSAGRRQLHKIVETVIETEIRFSYVWRGIEALPARTLPPQSLVLAVTPLLDERAIDALVDLRRRGFDVAIIEVSPVGYPAPPEDDIEELSLRLWVVWRRALRYRYERLGVPVVEWRDGEPLAGILEEVRTFRRYALQAPA